MTQVRIEWRPGGTQFHCCRTPHRSLIKVNLYSCILVLVVDLAAKIDVSRIDRFQSVSLVKRYAKERITCVYFENKNMEMYFLTECRLGVVYVTAVNTIHVSYSRVLRIIFR